jgi:hypothetical protein
MIEKESTMEKMIVPFKTPLDYYLEAMGGNPENIDKFPIIQKTLGWEEYDNDLHIYPYTNAKSAVLSMGCSNRCFFCPTAEHFKGKIVFGNPEIILPYYEGQNVHFMDEDFFHNDLKIVLPLLKKYHITWLAMTTYQNMVKVLAEFGEDYLYDCGLRCVELGLENVVLMKKAGDTLVCKKIAVYYLNMTCLPKETKESIQANAEWMKTRSLEHPIHFNNGVWYAPGQFYYPYGEERTDGIMTDAKKARTRPTFLPDSLIHQTYNIIDMEKVNYYGQLVYGLKMYPEETAGLLADFIGKDYKKACWAITGIRVGGII